jgi:hypothetical protein
VGDLCSLADVRQYLGFEDAVTTADALLTRLVSSASSWIQTQIGQQIAQQAYANEVHSGDGTTGLRLRYSPVVSVQSLVIDGDTVSARTATDEGYALQDDWLWLSGPSGSGGGIFGPYGPVPSPTRATALRFNPGNGNVLVSYTAGYATTPDDLRQAAIELAGETFLRRDRLGVMSKTVAGATTQYQTLSLSLGLSGVLDQYRRQRL